MVWGNVVVDKFQASSPGCVSPECSRRRKYTNRIIILL